MFALALICMVIMKFDLTRAFPWIMAQHLRMNLHTECIFHADFALLTWLYYIYVSLIIPTQLKTPKYFNVSISLVAETLPAPWGSSLEEKKRKKSSPGYLLVKQEWPKYYLVVMPSWAFGLSQTNIKQLSSNTAPALQALTVHCKNVCKNVCQNRRFKQLF